ncbi:MAG: CotH kinase family protein [bacterium]|nr:CotH kinase family protein [bacterium]
MTSSLYKLWRLPFRYAIWLVVPLQVVMILVAHRGWVHYRRNLECRYKPDRSPPFEVDQWRYFTKKELERSLYRTFAPDVPAGDLDTLSLTIDGRHLGELNADLPDSGKTTYYPATLTVDGKPHRIKTRYMGDNHWHWLYPQKSWKIKCRGVDPIRDRATFNLKNPPDPTAIIDLIANELSADIGLISPDVHPVKLFVNGAYSGLHLWWDRADESLLRRFRRMPGSIYSGDGAPPDKNGIYNVFVDEKFWTKDAARNAEQAADRADIRSLILAINEFDAPTFHAFVTEFVDLDQFAKFTAVDRLFGGEHHDHCHNHKVYFDPYRGRFEPIQWDFAFWMMHRRYPGIDQALNPLLMRVREHPAFELAIQRELAKLLERVTPERLAERVETAAASIRSALHADGFRDTRDHKAWRNLRLALLHSAFYSNAEFESQVRYLVRGFKGRTKWLHSRLADCGLQLRSSHPPTGPAVLTLRSTGFVGQTIENLTARTTAANTTVELVRDQNRNGVADAGDPVVATATSTANEARFALDLKVLPGLKKVPQAFTELRGGTQLSPTPLDYSFLLRPVSGGITAVELTATNTVTGEPVAPEAVDELPAVTFGSNESAHSLHPWDLTPQPAERTLDVGPGEVVLTESLALPPTTTVVIKPGTTLRLGPDVSVEFRGKVLALGTEEEPILIEPADAARPWGVFALHGIGTRGSRFTHCQWRDGSTDKFRMVLRTGMVSIIDTADIEMQNCFIGRNFKGDDALHWGYVTGGEIRDCEFRGAASDAFDMDIGKDVRIVGCRFYESGNDSLDLMTTECEVADCHFIDAGDKGISVGEGTRLTLLRSSFERCVIGIEIKDSSVAKVDAETRFNRCGTGVNLYRKNTRYTNGGTLIAPDLWAIGCDKPLTADKRSTVHVDNLHTSAGQN